MFFNLDVLNLKENGLVEKANNAMMFYMDYVVNNFMLPGQVESWIFVINLGKIGITSLPTTVSFSFFYYFNSRL